MPRGRPKGTTHPKGIANAVWQCVIIKCDNGRHPVNRASGLVAKDIAKLFPEWNLSGVPLHLFDHGRSVNVPHALNQGGA
jgi:hypothetical protein